MLLLLLLGEHCGLLVVLYVLVLHAASKSGLDPSIALLLLQIHIIHDGVHVYDDGIVQLVFAGRFQLRLTLEQANMQSIGRASGQILHFAFECIKHQRVVRIT